MTLAQLLTGPDDRVRYTYDPGDNWEHDIVLEKVTDPEPGHRSPMLLTGNRASPPEDCGGRSGYAELKDAGDVDPDVFDLEQAQRHVRAAGY